jgi:hypothetical protein
MILNYMKQKTEKETKEKKVDGILQRKINIYGAITTPNELIRETITNFLWGFVGNSIVLFISKELDVMVFINFLIYYSLMSYIVNRAKYQTRLGRFIILPGSAALGAFAGYKTAQWISLFF